MKLESYVRKERFVKIPIGCEFSKTNKYFALHPSQFPIVGSFEELPIAAQARANPPKTDTNKGEENRQEQDNSPHKDSNGCGKYGFY